MNISQGEAQLWVSPGGGFSLNDNISQCEALPWVSPGGGFLSKVKIEWGEALLWVPPGESFWSKGNIDRGEESNKLVEGSIGDGGGAVLCTHSALGNVR